MKIVELKKSQRKNGRILAKLEDGSILRVTETELLHFGLREGRDLTEEELGSLRTSAGTSFVRAAAANMVGNRALSRQELVERLLRRGASESDAQEAATWMEEIGAIDDAAYAAALVRHCGGKGYGPARARDELRYRGIARELWDEALEELPDPAGILDGLIRKKRPKDLNDRREYRRVSDSLIRRGFDWDDVWAALERYKEQEEE